MQKKNREIQADNKTMTERVDSYKHQRITVIIQFRKFVHITWNRNILQIT